MPGCGIEHSAVAVRSHPGPWLASLLVDSVFQNGSVGVVVQMMNVGFIPTAESSVATRDGMLHARGRRLENPGAVSLKLGTDQGDQFGLIAETERGAVQRNKSAAVGNVVQDGFGECVVDLVDVRIHHKRVKFFEVVLGQLADFVGVDQRDPAFGHRPLQFVEPLSRLMGTLVAQKQGPNLSGVPDACQHQTQSERGESDHGGIPARGGAGGKRCVFLTANQSRRASPQRNGKMRCRPVIFHPARKTPKSRGETETEAEGRGRPKRSSTQRGNHP